MGQTNYKFSEIQFVQCFFRKEHVTIFFLNFGELRCTGEAGIFTCVYRRFLQWTMGYRNKWYAMHTEAMIFNKDTFKFPRKLAMCEWENFNKWHITILQTAEKPLVINSWILYAKWAAHRLQNFRLSNNSSTVRVIFPYGSSLTVKNNKNHSNSLGFNKY